MCWSQSAVEVPSPCPSRQCWRDTPFSRQAERKSPTHALLSRCVPGTILGFKLCGKVGVKHRLGSVGVRIVSVMGELWARLFS